MRFSLMMLVVIFVINLKANDLNSSIPFLAEFRNLNWGASFEKAKYLKGCDLLEGQMVAADIKVKDGKDALGFYCKSDFFKTHMHVGMGFRENKLESITITIPLSDESNQSMWFTNSSHKKLNLNQWKRSNVETEWFENLSAELIKEKLRKSRKAYPKFETIVDKIVANLKPNKDKEKLNSHFLTNYKNGGAEATNNNIYFWSDAKTLTTGMSVVVHQKTVILTMSSPNKKE